jgi:iron complex transport system substrate-binding protein
MPDHLSKSTAEKRSTGSLKYIAVIACALIVLVAGIELARRLRTSPDTVTKLPDASARAANAFPRELRDAKGETLVIASKPQRIVSQTLGTDEILLAICPPERIVALSNIAGDANYSNVVDKASQIEGRTTEGAEQILKLNADLIFAASYSRAETVKLLQESKAPVFRFANFDSIADVIANIRTVGYATGCDAEAEKLIKEMNEKLDALRAQASQSQLAPRVMSYDRAGYTAGANTLFDDLLRAAGAVNVSAEKGLNGFSTVSVEKIAEWQPDVIVTGENRTQMENARKELLSNPVIASSPAGRAGRILVMDNRHFLTVSQFVVSAVEDLADGFYGKQK